MFPFSKKRKLFNKLVLDVEYYRQQNRGDVLFSATDKELKNHFLNVGLNQGRSASPVFDASYYLAHNPDVREIAGNDYKKAVDHFLSSGVHQNRRTAPDFDINFYYNNNEDLQKIIGKNYLELYNHYLQHGRKEKRVCNPNGVPDSFMIELTNRCNLRCTTCPREYKFGHEMNIGNMERAGLDALLEEIIPIAGSINLTGLGETFLYKDLPEVVEFLASRDKNITTFLSTNAQTPNCLPVFEKILGKIDLVQISIDGVDEVYERVRNGARFSTLAANVKKMAEMAEGTKTSLMFNMVAFDGNYRTIPSVVECAESSGVSHVHVNSKNLVTIPELDISDYQFYKTSEFTDMMAQAEELAGKLGIGFSTFSSKNWCELVYNHFYITWNGYLVPCCAKPFPKEHHFGNVFEEPLMTCIRRYQNSEFRSQWDAGNIPAFCKRCHVVH